MRNLTTSSASAILLALAFAACAPDNLPTEPTHDVAGAPAAQAVTGPSYPATNNNDLMRVGQSWLKLSVECMAATYPNDQFEFTSFTPTNYRLTSHDHEVDVGFSFTQQGALNVADVWTRFNTPSAPWVHRSYVWSLVQQASEPSGGRVDFKVAPPGGSGTVATQASCTLQPFFGGALGVMSNAIQGNGF